MNETGAALKQVISTKFRDRCTHKLFQQQKKRQTITSVRSSPLSSLSLRRPLLSWPPSPARDHWSSTLAGMSSPPPRAYDSSFHVAEATVRGLSRERGPLYVKWWIMADSKLWYRPIIIPQITYSKIPERKWAARWLGYKFSAFAQHKQRTVTPD